MLDYILFKPFQISWQKSRCSYRYARFPKNYVKISGIKYNPKIEGFFSLKNTLCYLLTSQAGTFPPKHIHPTSRQPRFFLNTCTLIHPSACSPSSSGKR